VFANYLANEATLRPLLLPGLLENVRQGRQLPVTSQLTSLHSQWDAISDWTIANKLGKLRDNSKSDIGVEVELVAKGKGYMDPSWQRVTMPLG
jgi:phage tail sheath protein FI